jgi:hypothetical protein
MFELSNRRAKNPNTKYVLVAVQGMFYEDRDTVYDWETPIDQKRVNEILGAGRVPSCARLDIDSSLLPQYRRHIKVTFNVATFYEDENGWYWEWMNHGVRDDLKSHREFTTLGPSNPNGAPGWSTFYLIVTAQPFDQNKERRRRHLSPHLSYRSHNTMTIVLFRVLLLSATICFAAECQPVKSREVTQDQFLHQTVLQR